MPPQSVLVGETGPDINQPVNQTTQPGSEPAQVGAMGNALQDDIIVSSPRTHQQLDELGVRMMDIGTNTSDIEVGPHRDGAKIVTSDANNQAPFPIVDVMIPSGGGDLVAIPQINLFISGYGPDSLRDSHVGTPAMRAQEISILPQLDGPVSIPVRDPTGGRVAEDTRLVNENIPKEVHTFKGPPYSKEGNTPERVVLMIIPTGDHIGIGDPLKGEDIQVRVEDHLIKEDIPIGMEGLLKEEDILEDDPLMVEDPLMEMKDPLDHLVDKNHQALKDPLGQ